MTPPDSPAAEDYRQQCFLCLRSLGGSLPSTREHVLPQWLMSLAGLTDALSVLPGGQLFKYGQRTVPCCGDCNGFLDRGLEKPVSGAVTQGFDAVRALPTPTLVLWLAKIYYGTRWRELALRTDVTEPASPLMLAQDELLRAVDYLRLLLLSGPAGVGWTAPPASLFLYRAGVSEDPAYRFDFFVSTVGTDFISVRINDVFAMCVFGENGHWQRALGGSPPELACQQLALHPVQCTEAMFRVYTLTAAYQSSGCFDMIEIGTGGRTLPGGVQRLFIPQFSVQPTGVPTNILDLAFVEALFNRSFGASTPQSLLDDAKEGRVPTCIRDPYSGEPVQAQCFEPGCTDVLLRAGWVVGPSGQPCKRCGSDGS